MSAICNAPNDPFTMHMKIPVPDFMSHLMSRECLWENDGNVLARPFFLVLKTGAK